MRYKTVIWDLDGTLLDTVEDLCDSVNAALASRNLPQRSLAFIRATIGNGIASLVRQSMPEGTEDLFDEVFAFFKQHYAGNCTNKTKPYEGMESVVSRLAAMGVPMAIVSNKVDSAAKVLGKLWFPDTIPVVLGEIPEFKRKPAPDTVDEALRLLGVGRENAVYIGDSEVDIATAANSGLGSIIVSWGFRPAELMRQAGAKVIIDTPEELFRYITEE